MVNADFYKNLYFRQRIHYVWRHLQFLILELKPMLGLSPDLVIWIWFFQ